MSCKYCKDLREKYAEEGEVVRVFHADKYEGEAILEERRKDREVPYVKKRCLACGDIINFIKQRWKVTFVSGNRDGWTTVRKIPVFHSIGLTSTQTKHDPYDKEESEEEE